MEVKEFDSFLLYKKCYLRFSPIPNSTYFVGYIGVVRVHKVIFGFSLSLSHQVSFEPFFHLPEFIYLVYGLDRPAAFMGIRTCFFALGHFSPLDTEFALPTQPKSCLSVTVRAIVTKKAVELGL